MVAIILNILSTMSYSIERTKFSIS